MSCARTKQCRLVVLSVLWVVPSHQNQTVQTCCPVCVISCAQSPELNSADLLSCLCYELCPVTRTEQCRLVALSVLWVVPSHQNKTVQTCCPVCVMSCAQSPELNSADLLPCLCYELCPVTRTKQCRLVALSVLWVVPSHQNWTVQTCCPVCVMSCAQSPEPNSADLLPCKL